MRKIKVKLVDGLFSGGHGFRLNGGDEKLRHGLGFGNRKKKPCLMSWDRSLPSRRDTVVFTDDHLRIHKQYKAKKRIALLIESPEIRPDIYSWIGKHFDEFDIILTHQMDLVKLGYPFLFYPLGGSWIKKWGMFPKTKMISTVVSSKRETRGHLLRHEAAKLVDSYGTGVGDYVKDKAKALREYRFAIVIENAVSDAYFSEKLIDAMSQGCVPIYRGCPDIKRFFNPYGIIQWRHLDGLKGIVKSLVPEDYEKYKPHVQDNMERARSFQCPEDWIVSTYPRVFGEKGRIHDSHGLYL